MDLLKINLTEKEAQEVLEYYKPQITEKIFEDLYALKQKGTYLTWNRLFRRWIVTGPVYFDFFN